MQTRDLINYGRDFTGVCEKKQRISILLRVIVLGNFGRK